MTSASLADSASEAQFMKRYRLPIAIVWIGAAAFALPAWPAETTPAEGASVSARPADPDNVTLNFVDTDIEGVVKAVSEITGKNFVLDPHVKGTRQYRLGAADGARAGVRGVPLGAATAGLRRRRGTRRGQDHSGGRRQTPRGPHCRPER